jgi:hypothetical protein
LVAVGNTTVSVGLAVGAGGKVAVGTAVAVEVGLPPPGVGEAPWGVMG